MWLHQPALKRWAAHINPPDFWFLLGRCAWGQDGCWPGPGGPRGHFHCVTRWGSHMVGTPGLSPSPHSRLQGSQGLKGREWERPGLGSTASVTPGGLTQDSGGLQAPEPLHGSDGLGQLLLRLQLPRGGVPRGQVAKPAQPGLQADSK